MAPAGGARTSLPFDAPPPPFPQWAHPTTSQGEGDLADRQQFGVFEQSHFCANSTVLG